jgi:hypothetical protein
LTGKRARDGKIDDTKRVLPMVVHLAVYDIPSADKQNNHKHKSQGLSDSLFMNHETSCYVWM